jgi:hypothetical protein
LKLRDLRSTLRRAPVPTTVLDVPEAARPEPFWSQGEADGPKKWKTLPLPEAMADVSLAKVSCALLTEDGEARYPGYGRVAYEGIITGGSTLIERGKAPVKEIAFPYCSGGSETITAFAIYDGEDLLIKGELTSPITVSTGVVPVLPVGSIATMLGGK